MLSMKKIERVFQRRSRCTASHRFFAARCAPPPFAFDRPGDDAPDRLQSGSIGMTATNPYGITDKEAAVLRLVDPTRSTGEIASTVGRSIHTVEAQIKSARRK